MSSISTNDTKSTITAHARITLTNDALDLPGAFGRGCADLLEGVKDLHSLNRSAKRLGMAYSKAWRIIKEAEGQLGCELLVREGARGSSLTPEGEHVLTSFRTIESEVNKLLACRIPELFGRSTH